MTPPPRPPILLTAFEPFGGAAANASLDVARHLALDDPRLHLVTLPVVRGEAERVALDALRALTNAGGTTPPVLFLALGEARGASDVRLEKVAINWDYFRIPDNAGNQPRDEPIRANGPAAYFATLPVFEIAARLAGKTPVSVVVSLSAGAFVCNHLAYAVLDALATNVLDLPGSPAGFVFVHVPAVRPEDAGNAAPPLDDIVATVRTVIETLLPAASAAGHSTCRAVAG